MPVSVEAGLLDVRTRMRRAADRANRDVADVTLVAVSKGVDADRVEAALHAGVTDLGESRVQETPRLAHLRDAATFHLIGHLQTNKAKVAATLYDWVHSIDSAKLVRALDVRAQAASRVLDVLIEVNTSGEDSKHGATVDALPVVIEALRACPALRVRGLMTIGPRYGGEPGARSSFRALRSLRPAVADAFGSTEADVHLSMGMSDDFEIAIEEGATIVRVGSAIFGRRST